MLSTHVNILFLPRFKGKIARFTSKNARITALMLLALHYTTIVSLLCYTALMLLALHYTTIVSLLGYTALMLLAFHCITLLTLHQVFHSLPWFVIFIISFFL